MPVNFSDLLLAFEFVSSGGMGENEAYLDRQSGKIYWHSEFGHNDEELPDDIDDKKYAGGFDNKGYRGHQVWPESRSFPRILSVLGFDNEGRGHGRDIA